MDEDLRDRLRAWLIGPLGLPLPAALVHALVLIGSRRVWTDVMVTTSRSGRSGEVIVAHVHLGVLAACTLLFWGTYALRGALDVPASFAMRAPTAGEQGCVLALLRGALLLAVYYSAYALVRGYVV